MEVNVLDYVIERLRVIQEQEPRTIRSCVAKEALEYGGTPKEFFHDLLSHGCISGMIGSLIYYSDTHAFFEKHYDEIDEIRQEYENQTGQTLKIQGDMKNYLAWFSFEHIAWEISHELKLCI